MNYVHLILLLNIKEIITKESELKSLTKEIEQLKNEIEYKVVAQIPIEEYRRKCDIIELERNNKLKNTKYYIYNNEITIEKYIKTKQKKRR